MALPPGDEADFGKLCGEQGLVVENRALIKSAVGPGCTVETYPGLASIKSFKPWKAARHRRR
jgi:hypothetical protein